MALLILLLVVINANQGKYRGTICKAWVGWYWFAK